MINEIKELIKSKGLEEEFAYELSTLPTPMTRNLLDFCIENNLYKYLLFFPSEVWDETLVPQVKDHIREMLDGYYYTPKFPECLLNSPEILQEYMKTTGSLSYLCSFKEETWTVENLTTLFELYGLDNGNYNQIFKNKFNIIPNIIKTKNTKLLAIFPASAITEEIADLIIEEAKKDRNILKNFPRYNSILLKKIIINKMFDNDEYYRDDCWTEENKELISKAYENNEVELTNKIRYIKGINKYMLRVYLLKGNFSALTNISKEFWTEDNIKLFIDKLEEYDKEYNFIPEGVRSSEVVLKAYLEKGLSKSINTFNIEAFTMKNIDLVFTRIDEFGRANSLSRLFESIEGLKKVIENNRVSYLKYFTPKEISEEIEDELINIYSENLNEKVSYYFISKRFIKKLLASNNLTTASYVYKEKVWDDELVEEYFKRLLSYDKEVNYSNYYLDGAYSKKLVLALEVYLKTKRYAGIEKFKYSNETIWTEDNLKLLDQDIDNIYENNLMPSITYTKTKYLLYFLDKGDIEKIRQYKSNLWDNKCFSKYINLYNESRFNNINYVNFDANDLNTPFMKYALLGSRYTKYSFYKENTRLENILQTEISDELTKENSLMRLIKDTESLKVYMHLLALVDGDESKLDTLFNENGPKQETIEELIFDKDYIKCCIREDKKISFKNEVYKKYFEIVKKYPDILDCTFITKDLINDFFDENGPKDKLYNHLFCPNGAKVLEELNEEYNYLSAKKMYVLKKYIRIDEQNIKEKFLNYCFEHEETLKEDKIDDVYNVLKRIETSNSSEILRFKESLADQILQFDNPSEKLDEVEKIFLQNNLPNVGKIFLVFKTLYPDYSSFKSNTISPTLKVGNDFNKDTIIFSDLLRITIGSNNRDFNEYVNSLVTGNKIYRLIKTNQKDIKDLTNEEQIILQDFLSHINVLYKNTLTGKKDKRTPKENIIEEIEEIKRLLDPYNSSEQELPDRIIYMFAHAAGFDNVKDLKQYQEQKLREREQIHRKISNQGKIKLQKGDLIKGIKNVKYLANILNNGSLCGEFLGENAGSDCTPLDADLSLIEEDFTTNEDSIKSTPSHGYGNTFLVLKSDSRFNLTRTNSEDGKPSNRKEHRPELFQTGFLGKNHYGIRTGFASSDIDYILTSENPKRICLDVALSGIYIPVVDMNGNVIFTYEDYQKIRKNMQGLSHFGLETEYKVAPNVSQDQNVKEISKKLAASRKDIKAKQAAIYEKIAIVAEKYGYKLNKKLTKNLQPGTIECIDTGSTGRGTNIPNDADFDFIMRLDRELLTDEKKLNEFKKDLLKAFNKDTGIISTGDFRLKEVEIDGVSVPLDIDISFVVKTNDINYSTDMCIKDRLDTIKKLYPDKYDEVIANIILAKQILKENHCYKANRGDHPEGGLCGVGVENWILQNGGSLLEAAKDFVTKAYGKSFDEFKKEFSVYNYGENFLAQRRGWYVHDDYVADNMSESGYNKMVETLQKYIKSVELGQMNIEPSEEISTVNHTLSH